MLTKRRINHNSTHIWPSFVDVMASVLMVLLFVLMTFVLSQIYLTDALNDKTNSVLSLEDKIKDLSLKLQDEKTAKENAVSVSNGFKNELEKLLKDIKELNKQKEENKKKIEASESNLSTILKELQDLKKQYVDLDEKTKAEIHQLNQKNKKTDQINEYRSQFFEKLIKVMKDRDDIRIVGDRFVFESEVLFSLGSAKLNEEGEKHLESLVEALLEISKKIPDEINWVLRIDGHTDDKPIKRDNLKSNWELSTARAISVVKFLIKKGISPQKLIAAGFAEYQPITNKPEEQAKNRRIEFRFDLLK